MLVITRRPSEGIVIEFDKAVITESPESIKFNVVILGIRGKQVRVGIDAHESVKVHREEVYQRKQLEKEQDEPKKQEYSLVIPF